jgi:hypothetical protein
MSLRTFCLCAVLLIFPATTDADEERLRSFVGTWAYSGGSAQIDALRRAVEAATAKMNFLIRGLARSRLVDRQTPQGTIQFELAGSELRTVVEGLYDGTGPFDGTEFTVVNQSGDEVRVTQRIEQGSLFMRIRFAAEGTGQREVWYTLAEGGATLTQSSRLEVDRLPEPLVLEFSYARE